MTAPFDTPAEPVTPGGAIAWLRVLPTDAGDGVVAALFETSVEGEPLGFHFTRRGLGETDRAAHAGAIHAVVEALLRAASPSPTVLVGLAAEIPAAPVDAAKGIRVPFCVLGPAGRAQATGDAGTGRTRHTWMAPAPQDGSDARRILETILASADPLEPTERAAMGLREAFDDPHVQALAASSGLSTVVSLLPATDRHRAHPQPVLGGGQAPSHDRDSEVGDPARGDPIPRAATPLADRLRDILQAPAGPVRLEHLAWDGDLMPFQRDGVRALLENRRLLLADDMGLGKTVQAIVALRILHARRESGSCLVAAPASVLDQWRREIARWAPELSAMIIRGSAADREWQWAARTDVTLVGYESLRADFDVRLSRRAWDVVIADEAQRIKNRNATSDVLKSLRRSRSWALTGTPIENHEEELASILEFVDHGERGGRSQYRPGPELRERHRELQLRRKKGDVTVQDPS